VDVIEMDPEDPSGTAEDVVDEDALFAEVPLEHSPFADEALRDDEDRDAPAGPDPEVLTPDEAAAPVADPEQPSLVDEAANEPSRPIKRKRASVPSWDEIMFGSPAPKPRE